MPRPKGYPKTAGRLPHPAIAEAVAKGEKTYWTGEPCSRGHIAPRSISQRYCTVCRNEAVNKSRKADPDKSKVNAHKNWIELKYELTIAEYNKLIKDQENKCQICLRFFDKRPHVDHCHKSGKVRGLLCGSCNRALGFMRDDKNAIKRMLEYLS